MKKKKKKKQSSRHRGVPTLANTVRYYKVEINLMLLLVVIFFFFKFGF